MPLLILIPAVLLQVWGIAMLFAASGGSWAPWAGKQLLHVGLGMVGASILAFMPYRLLFRSAWMPYLAGLLLLVLVAVMGHTGMGAQRWLAVGGVTLQPSEPMKLALILMLASYFHQLGAEAGRRLFSLLVPALLTVIPVLLILKQPNLGTATITMASAVILFWGAGVSWKLFAAGGALVGTVIPVAWHWLLHDYQKERVLTFLEPERDPLGAGYNLMQSKIAIGSGGGWGRGFLEGSQTQLSFLPEKQTDFVFTMLAESFGFAGGLAMILLYILLLMGILILTLQCQNGFGRLVALGINGLLWVHLTINVGMVMGLLPVVGVPLPFLSYGGTMGLASWLAIGLLVAVHRNRQVGVL
jgi:rod shape determining protein RodA